MWRILRFAVLAVVVLVVAALAVPFFLPTSVYKQQIIDQARIATGRALNIDGDLKISFFPSLGVEVTKVRFSNIAGAAEPEMVTMDELVVGAEFWPLLSGNLKVNQVRFVNPVIHLEIDDKGRGNWLFEPQRPIAAPNKPEPPPSSTSSAEFSFRDVTLTGGVVTYRDARTGTNQRVEAIDATVKLPSLDQPMEFGGGLTWNKEAVKINALVANPRALSNGQKSAVEAKVEGAVLRASFDGTVDAAGSAIEGKVDFATESAQRLAAWSGVELPKVQGFGPMTLSGEMSAGADFVAFKNAKLSLDGMNGGGNLRLETAKAVPHITGEFSLDRLDLNPYLGHGSGGAGGKAKSGGSSGWSDRVIDFSALRMVDADLDFAVNSFAVNDMKIGRCALQIALAGGKLKARLKEMALYGGSGAGAVELDGAGDVPGISLDLAVQGVQAQSFLDDFIGVTRISGTATIVATLASVGRSERQWMRAVSGATRVRFQNGAVHGIDLAQIARTIEAAIVGNAFGPQAKTDFAELSGSFVARGGVAANRDLRLVNPYVRLNGVGLVDLGSRTIDYRVEPKAVGKGRGGVLDIGGIGIPFRIKGPWSNPSYEPDLSGVMSSTLDSILKGGNPLDNLKGAGDGLGDLLGGIGGTQQEGASGKKGDKKKKPKSDNPLDQLKGLFGN